MSSMVNWGLLAGLSLQNHFCHKNNSMVITCANFEFPLTLSKLFTVRIVIAGFEIHVQKIRQLQHHLKN